MERISDYCENVSEFAETLYERKAEFSEIGKAQMKEMIDVCIKSYHYALLAFENQDPEMAMKVIEEETKADDLEVQLRSDHMQRMANGQCDGSGNRVPGCTGMYGTYFRPCEKHCGARRLSRKTWKTEIRHRIV